MTKHNGRLKAKTQGEATPFSPVLKPRSVISVILLQIKGLVPWEDLQGMICRRYQQSTFRTESRNTS